MGLFDKLIEEVAETDREVFKRYPKLAEKVDSDDQKLTEWENWRKQHFNEELAMTNNAVEALRQKDAEIEALRLLQAGDMNWDDMKGNVETLIQANLKNGKVATQDDINRFLEAERAKLTVKVGDKQIPITEYAQNLERGMEMTYAKTAHLPAKYYREFGDKAPEFTIEALFKHMQDNKISRFEDAYDSYVKPLRDEKQATERTAELERVKAEAKAEAKAEWAMKGGSLPTDSEGSAPQATALQRRIGERKKVEVQGPKLTPGSLGDGSAGNDAYQQYLKDQAAGVKPTVIQ